MASSSGAFARAAAADDDGYAASDGHPAHAADLALVLRRRAEGDGVRQRRVRTLGAGQVACRWRMKAQQSLVFSHARMRRCVSASARAFCSAPVSSESTKRCTACGRSRQSIWIDLRSLRSGSCTCHPQAEAELRRKSAVGRRRAAGSSCSRRRFHSIFAGRRRRRRRSAREPRCRDAAAR